MYPSSTVLQATVKGESLTIQIKPFSGGGGGGGGNLRRRLIHQRNFDIKNSLEDYSSTPRMAN